MNKNNGFTLIELLAVIVILAIIAVVAVPSILKIISNSKIATYNLQINSLKQTAKTYLTKNIELFPSEVGQTISIKISDLQGANLIDQINGLNAENCNGYLLITKIKSNSYSYNPQINCYSDGEDNNDLVAYWKLDGDAIDYSLGNHHGNIVGATPTKDRFGEANKAMKFDGNDYIEIVAKSENDSVGMKNSFTISTWVKFDNINNNSRVGNIIGNYGNNYHFNFEGFKNGIARFYCHNGTPDIQGSKDLRGAWHYIVAVKDHEEKKIIVYIDGEVETTANSLYNYDIYYPILIGSDFREGGLHYHGDIDDIKIYNKALKAEEIKNNYLIERYNN